MYGIDAVFYMYDYGLHKDLKLKGLMNFKLQTA